MAEKKRCCKDENKIGGAILMTLGAIFLLNTTGISSWVKSWPLILIGIGTILLLSSRWK